MVFRVDAIQARLRRLEEIVSELGDLRKLDRAALSRALKARHQAS